MNLERIYTNEEGQKIRLFASESGDLFEIPAEQYDADTETYYEKFESKAHYYESGQTGWKYVGSA